MLNSPTAQRQPQMPTMEPAATSRHHLLCWKSVFAGVLISFMSYMILSALGAGIGGLTAESMIRHERGGMALATTAGLWMGLSAVTSLFLGSYFALRISKFVTYKVGAAHGFVISSVFFVLVMMGASSVIGSLSMGIGQIVSSVAQGTSTAASAPIVQDAFNKALSNTTLKSSPQEVATGLGARLLEGDVLSAKAYYAYQSGLPQAEVDARINQLQADFEQASKAAAESAARGVADAGWALFALFLVGLIAAVMGGRIGAHSNFTRPFATQANDERYESTSDYSVEMVPVR